MVKSVIFEKKNVLVAGGAGFIGSHLCDELIKTAKVICVDNFITGSEDNIHHLLQNSDFKFIRHDLVEPLDLEAAPELAPFKVAFQGVQEIYNLACPTSPKEYNRYPIETLLANSHGTKNLLDLAVKYQSRFLQMSSSAVYGEPHESTPFPEEYWGYIDPIGPRSAYNEGKRFAESLVVNYRKVHKIPAKIVRIFNTYGPRMKHTDGRLIPDLIAAALRGESLVIYGTEGDISTFCYITDLIEGVLRLMASEEAGPVNLGSAEERRVVDVAGLILNLTGSPSKVTFEPRLPYTAKQGTPNLEKARDALGWFPVVPLEEGLTRTIEYLQGASAIKLEELPIAKSRGRRT
jgi:nucleoside-diphosphate-sugar epimerase